jgi:hypothetical protein
VPDKLIPPEIGELATSQDGIVCRAQLRASGVSDKWELAQLAARRWTAFPPNAIALQNGPLSRRQTWWVAVLNAGPRSALSAFTALEADGLTGWERPGVEVLVPRGATGPRQAGVRVHESRRFKPSVDLHPTRLPRRTRIARSAIDAATWSRSPRTATGVLAAVVQQRLARPQEILDELERAGQVRHRRLLQRALADIAGGSQALSEIDFARLCRRASLPEPVRQAIRAEPSGRRRYLDAEWVRADGVRVVAEVDGAVHLLPRRYWDDMERANDLVLAGRVVLRFASFAVRAHEDRVAAQLRRALVSP